ncbi:hypothetical protein M0812_14504 [Anaeramoeba flamelloides]|uniref:BTB domain-containing protein n=1 Tax=Anaeramoeba flamelloides TaxID=1746091 RepID=A0AAV7ZIV3_9EUKA|nr:hypothetical protein M0812_14504 [Anaeramoeba flamelloides]
MSTHLIQSIRDIFNEKSRSDVELIVESEETKKMSKFYAHRLILSLSSNFFKKLFYPPNWKSQTKIVSKIILNDISPTIFSQILNYFYVEKIELNKSNCFTILLVAKKFEVSQLVDQVVDYIVENINCANFLQASQEPLVFGKEKNQAKMLRFLIDNFEKIKHLPTSFNCVPNKIIVQLLEKVKASIDQQEEELFIRLFERANYLLIKNNSNSSINNNINNINVNNNIDQTANRKHIEEFVSPLLEQIGLKLYNVYKMFPKLLNYNFHINQSCHLDFNQQVPFQGNTPRHQGEVNTGNFLPSQMLGSTQPQSTKQPEPQQKLSDQGQAINYLMNKPLYHQMNNPMFPKQSQLPFMSPSPSYFPVQRQQTNSRIGTTNSDQKNNITNTDHFFFSQQYINQKIKNSNINLLREKKYLENKNGIYNKFNKTEKEKDKGNVKEKGKEKEKEKETSNNQGSQSNNLNKQKNDKHTLKKQDFLFSSSLPVAVSLINLKKNINQKKTKTIESLQILLLTTDSNLEHQQDVVFSISTYGIKNIEIFNCSKETPSFGQIKKYDSIFMYSTTAPLKDARTIGNVLAQYVEDGGGLVLSTYRTMIKNPFKWKLAQLQGRIVSKEFLPFRKGKLISLKRAKLGNVLEANHPLIKNIENFDGGTKSYRIHCRFKLPINSEGQLVAKWSDGIPLISWVRKIKSNFGKIVVLNFHPVSGNCYPDRGRYSHWLNPDGRVMIANAVEWVSRDN